VWGWEVVGGELMYVVFFDKNVEEKYQKSE
jgi:hypothetical protein